MDIEYKHKQRKGKKTSIEDSRGREDRYREKKRRREPRRKGGKGKECEEETKIKK